MMKRSPAANESTPKRGRPPRKVFINVEVRATTRDALHAIKRSAGLKNQGQVIDWLVAQAGR
jgi:hypothetical protein